ncbi:MAG: DUF2971 domain-containing protein [Solimonas sp.]
MTTAQVLEFSEDQKKVLLKLADIFLPYASKKRKERFPSEGATSRFVHYTTAENALNIIETRRLWLRSTMCMSDYREVDHGHDLLLKAFSSNGNKSRCRLDEFTSVMEACVPGIAARAISTFDDNWDQIRCNTYVASLSEHDSGQEDLYGRLSMWRAFGGASGRVALIVSVPWFSNGVQLLKLIFSPVGYLTDSEVAQEFDSVIENIRTNADFLNNVSNREWIAGIVYVMFLSAVTCLKHCGFREEREWRLIHGAFPLFSDLMEHSIECINGIPQRVFKLPLEANISPELDFTQVFDRIVIGPTQYPIAMHGAFTAKLTEAGVPDAASKVFISDIPIRT